MKIEAIIVDGVVYDVKETDETPGCLFCDMWVGDGSFCRLIKAIDSFRCHIYTQYYFKRRETK